ncbi:PAS domain S-box protein [Methanosarcina sp.]|uniref:PAS domain S-box protein n=1 Tax=Methanosarcina sp. TaxID=2213 RepID=UPI002ABBD9BD|nr:PAS domain S-box protein [Methanosarcina sp.]MDY9927249.1 PAS domain S-box protein [Methanosarcina sp.]
MSSKLAKGRGPVSYEALADKNHALEAEIQDLRARLEEAEELKRAISEGDLDALVIPGPEGELIFTLDSADRAYRVLVETMNEGTATLAFDGTILYCNRQFAELVKLPSETVVGSSIYQFIVPENAIKFKALLKQEAGRGEINFQAGGGTSLPVYLSISSLKSEGSPNAWCLVATDLTEQKKNEEIVAAERLARSIIEQAAEAIVVCDTSGRITHFSNAVSRICRCDPTFQIFENLIDVRFSEGEDAGKSILPVSSALKGSAILGMEAVFELDDCDNFYQEYHLLLNSGPLKNSNGKIIGCVVTLADITERKQAEEALRESKEIARQRLVEIENLYRNAPVGLCELDRELRYVRINERLAEINGLPATAHIGKRVREVVPQLADAAEPQMLHILETGEAMLNIEIVGETLSQPGIKRSWLEQWLPITNAQGLVTGLNIVVEEITERKRTEEELREAYEQIQTQSEKLRIFNEELKTQSEELKEANEGLSESEKRFRTLAENSPDIIVRLDRQKRHIYVNAAVAGIYGRSPEEIIGKTQSELGKYSGQLESWEKHYENVFATGKPETVEFQYISAQGKKYYLNTKIVPEFVDGKVTSILAVSRDINDIKEAEAKLKDTLENLEEKVKERTSELEEAYESLMENEARLNEAQKIAHLGNWDWNILTNELYWSDEIYRIFGLDPLQFGKTYDAFLSYVHPDDRNRVNNAVKEALNRKPFSTDYRIISSYGEDRIVHANGEVIFDEKRTPVRMRGTIQDITENKREEHKMRRYNSVLEGINRIFGSVIKAETEEELGNSCLSVALEVTGGGIGFVGVVDTDGILHDIAISDMGWDECLMYDKTGHLRPPGDFTLHGLYGCVIDTGKSLFTNDPQLHPNSIGLPQGHPPLTSFLGVPLILDGKMVGILAVANREGGYRYEQQEDLEAIEPAVMQVLQRKKAEKALEKMDKVRIKEIHHRIKNNLQVLSSLLDLQAEHFEDENIIEAFRESQNRVISMSLIHEELYKGEGTDTLDFSAYLQKLAKNLFQTYSLSSKNIRLCMDLEENALFDMDIAVPLGIIVNELISNSLKHAFTENDEGEIRIQLCREEKNDEMHKSLFSLTISDNGKGIPEDLGVESVESLGLQLVYILVDQLDGEIELKRDHGTEFRITFNVLGSCVLPDGQLIL